MKKRIILILFLVMLVTLVACSKKSESHSSSSSYSYSSSSRSSTEMDHATYCLLYMSVSDVEVTHSSNYAYVTGTISNNGIYQIKYVKVRAACKNKTGDVIDTDWTYAVDSSWLKSGESKTFEMMVKDPDQKITSATVTIEYD